MNGFEMQGIKHTSASSINLWQNSPSLYIAEKLYGLRGRMSASAHRGTLIEKAVVDVLAHGRTEQDAVADALSAFHRIVALGSTDKERAEAEMIAPCVSLALGELKQYGEPSFPDHGGQNKIEVLCKGDGYEIPVLGFLDLVWPQHGLICDLKTVSRMNSEMPANHQRQAAIYQKASGNKAVKFLYVSAKKVSWLECNDVPARLAEIKSILNRQEKFLRLGDKEFLRQIVHHDPESFYFNTASQAAKDLFK